MIVLFDNRVYPTLGGGDQSVEDIREATLQFYSRQLQRADSMALGSSQRLVQPILGTSAKSSVSSRRYSSASEDFLLSQSGRLSESSVSSRPSADGCDDGEDSGHDNPVFVDETFDRHGFRSADRYCMACSTGCPNKKLCGWERTI